MSSLAYTEPVTVVLPLLTELFGEDYALTEYPADNDCGQSPAHLYSWADEDFGLSDRTGLTDIAPRDIVPYNIFSRVSELDGIEISTSVGISVGDDASALQASSDPENYTGILLLESGGTFVSLSGAGNGQTIQKDWGLFAASAKDPHVVEYVAAPMIASDFFC